ncbi:MAG: SAM-dependent methyltransferase [Limnobacter sp.]|nr:SAM-dependent methyltransferase [Limnobacter sp.]
MIILVPSPLSQSKPVLPVLAADLPHIQACRTWLVENAKPARAALQFFQMPVPIRDLEIVQIQDLNATERSEWVKKAKAGQPIAVMSDAGCPGVADPGAEMVALAHEHQCPVLPLVGPSSIILGLMGSGLNGQNFHFHGYPPLQTDERDKWIADSDRRSKLEKSTQMVIETPFRNQKLLEALLSKLSPSTRLCIGRDLTGEHELLKTQAVAAWKKQVPELGKHPTLFLWQAT